MASWNHEDVADEDTNEYVKPLPYKCESSAQAQKSKRLPRLKVWRQMGLKIPHKKIKHSSQRRMAASLPKRRGRLTSPTGTRPVWQGGANISPHCSLHSWPAYPSGATCARYFQTRVASCFTCVTSRSFSRSWCPATSAVSSPP